TPGEIFDSTVPYSVRLTRVATNAISEAETAIFNASRSPRRIPRLAIRFYPHDRSISYGTATAHTPAFFGEWIRRRRGRQPVRGSARRFGKVFTLDTPFPWAPGQLARIGPSSSRC